MAMNIMISHALGLSLAHLSRSLGMEDLSTLIYCLVSQGVIRDSHKLEIEASLDFNMTISINLTHI